MAYTSRCDSLREDEMATRSDFERAWPAVLSGNLDIITGAEIRREVMAGSEDLSFPSGTQDVIDWSRDAMDRLDSLLDEEKRQKPLCGAWQPRTMMAVAFDPESNSV